MIIQYKLGFGGVITSQLNAVTQVGISMEWAALIEAASKFQAAFRSAANGDVDISRMLPVVIANLHEGYRSVDTSTVAGPGNIVGHPIPFFEVYQMDNHNKFEEYLFKDGVMYPDRDYSLGIVLYDRWGRTSDIIMQNAKGEYFNLIMQNAGYKLSARHSGQFDINPEFDVVRDKVFADDTVLPLGKFASPYPNHPWDMGEHMGKNYISYSSSEDKE